MSGGDPFLALHGGSGGAPTYPEEAYWWLPSPPTGAIAGPSTLPILEALARSPDSSEASPPEDGAATAAKFSSPAATATSSKSPDGPRPREPKRRTRTGCKLCRERRVKCDEGKIDRFGQKSACRNCVVRGVPCQYPALTDDGSGTTRQWASPAPSAQQDDPPTSTSSTAPTNRQVAPTLARIAREAAQKLALATTVGAPEYTVLETLAAGGDPVRFIGTAAVTDPEHDHFQAEMLPFLRRQFSRSSKPPEDDRAVLYHSAIRLGFIARPETLTKAEEHRMLANEACNRAVARRCESETLMIARALLLLGNIIISQPIAVPADHLVADLTSPLGYQIYDILCAYRTWIALVDGTQRISTPVPLAGDRYLESTFGIARSMWDLLGRTIDLLVQRRTLDALPIEMTRPLLEPDVTAILEKGQSILETVRHSRSKRIQQGTEMYYLMITILLVCEALDFDSSDDRVTASRMRMLAIQAETPLEEQLVGYNLPLSIATFYCSSPAAALQLQVLRQSVGLQRCGSAGMSTLLVPDAMASAVAHRLAIDSAQCPPNSTGSDASVRLGRKPWRDACKSLGIDIII